MADKQKKDILLVCYHFLAMHDIDEAESMKETQKRMIFFMVIVCLTLLGFIVSLNSIISSWRKQGYEVSFVPVGEWGWYSLVGDGRNRRTGRNFDERDDYYLFIKRVIRY